MNSKLFFLFVVGFQFLFFTCTGKSKLPKRMPDKVEFRYGENGGMSPYYKSIEIVGDTLIFIEKTYLDDSPIKWSKKIELVDKENLYQVFVENKFDRIKNKSNKHIVYDAGSEGASISFPGANYYVQYGANFPLSDKNRISYNNIVSAIQNLVFKYKSNQK